MKRRSFLLYSGTLLAASQLSHLPAWGQEPKSRIITKPVPPTGEKIPAIGMGTWITFNVGQSEKLRQARTEVVKAFLAGGGRVIDSSPMYGSSEEVVGHALSALGQPKEVFAATKIWTTGKSEGEEQFQQSKKLWGRAKIDLEQIHNLQDWKTHLKTLRALKEKGEIRYLGITTSHGRRHDEIISILKSEPIDFLQLTYNIQDREVEGQLLELAQEKRVAVIANRPYGGGSIIKTLKSKKLPPWAGEVHAATWAEFLLKFVISHPALTVAIPATTRVDHMNENIQAMRGELPTAAQRMKMASYVAAL